MAVKNKTASRRLKVRILPAPRQQLSIVRRNNVELDLPQLEEIEKKLDLVLSGSGTVGGKWFTLEQAHAFKFGKNGPALSTVKNFQALQPRAGVPDDWQQGKRVWKRETIEEWSQVTDSTLGDYLERVAPGKKVPDFIVDSMAKRSSVKVRNGRIA